MSDDVLTLFSPSQQARFRCKRGHETVGLFEIKTFAPAKPGIWNPPIEWQSGPLCRICWAIKQAEGCETEPIGDSPS